MSNLLVRTFAQEIMLIRFKFKYCCNLYRHFHKQSAQNLTRAKIKNTSIMTDVRCRDDPVVIKLDSPEFKSIFTPELEALSSLFKKYKYDIRIAGGAVRDLLMGKKPIDLDFATTATPTQMKDMFTTENIRMINMNGEKHGTITPRINDKENFEVTTLRIDRVTDGRHAEVEFTTDWKLDANRRDLTINSMFLDFDGVVYDYFYGYDDLKQKRVAFVGSPETRIKEDYLRILRYFRFYGRISDRPDAHEPSVLQCIGENGAGLERISGERIWVELKKILEGPMGFELAKTMLSVGLATYIGLPAKYNLEEFTRVCEADRSRSKDKRIRAIGLLVGLLHDQTEMMNLHNRLKLSAFERDLGLFIIANREEIPSTNPIFLYQMLIINSPKKYLESKAMVLELLKYQNKNEIYNAIEKWELPKFPVNGNDLRQHGLVAGKYMGNVLNALKKTWAENDFKMTREELLKLVPGVLSELGFEAPPKK